MSRLHPFDIAFGRVADEWFAGIQAAATTAQSDASDLAQFARLEPVQSIIAQLQPDGETVDTAEATEEYLRLLYAGYQFWKDGRQTFSVSRRAALEAIARLARSFEPPTLDAAAYYRFPEHWFWAQLDPKAPHEPLDGLFVVAGGRRGREWVVIAVLGLRTERGGFSQISVTAAPEDLGSAVASVRDPAFAPAMEGGGVAGFRSITSIAELLVAARVALASTG